MNEIIIYVIIQIINVVISTVKSIMTVNGSKEIAAIVSAISYTFGAIIIKLVSKQEFVVVIAVTFFTNLIGVYIAKYILDKVKKERLWTFSATIKGNKEDEIQELLKLRNIKYVLLDAKNNRSFVNIFSRSKGESTMIKEILEEVGAKYNVIEARQ